MFHDHGDCPCSDGDCSCEACDIGVDEPVIHSPFLCQRCSTGRPCPNKVRTAYPQFMPTIEFLMLNPEVQQHIIHHGVERDYADCNACHNHREPPSDTRRLLPTA